MAETKAELQNYRKTLDNKATNKQIESPLASKLRV